MTEDLDPSWIGDDELYREHILDHYRHPHHFGKMEHASCSARQVNPLCGDEITVYVSLRDAIIHDISFVGKGCALSIASASLLTDHLQEKSLDVARAMTDEDIMKLLGVRLGVVRMKCGLLSLRALHAALDGVV